MAAPIRVCFFGDSFVNGTGDDACLGWVGRACAAGRRNGMDLTCYNLGIRGDTSADVLRRWEHEARARLAPGDAIDVPKARRYYRPVSAEQQWSMT